MAKQLKEAAKISLISNIILFLIKAVIGVISNSIAVISDAINALTDIASSAAIMYSVKVSFKKPDEEHQFGHHAAQPIAVFVVALFSAIVSIELIKSSIERISSSYKIHASIPIYITIVVTIVAKIILTRYQKRVGITFKSPGLKASAVDSLNDVLSTSISLLGLIGVQLGFKYVDGIGGIIIAVIIMKSVYDIVRENIGYLMGQSADETLILQIANAALKTEGVRGINELNSHYIGNKFNVEIHIDVDKNFSTEKSHDIGKSVEKQISKIPDINKVFVHIDPV
jgi:cation diffusion facilitator family transporter